MPLMSERVIESEVATYRFAASIGIPVPKVLDYAVNAESSHGFGLAYILMEKVKGEALDDGAFLRYDPEIRTKVFTQYASIHAKLADNPLPAVGSLLCPDSPRVGALTSFLTGHPLDFGPFTSARAFWNARIDVLVTEIAAKRMYSRNGYDAYLAALFLREQVDILLPADSPEDTQFYLRHMDDKGDHIMLDDEFNIAAVVDWEFAWVVPRAQALAAPIWVAENILHEPTVPCAAEAQFASILRGAGREDLAALSERGRPYFFMEQCFRSDWTAKDFTELNSDALRTLLGKPMTWDEWKAQALVRYADDPILQALYPRPEHASPARDA